MGKKHKKESRKRRHRSRSRSTEKDYDKDKDKDKRRHHKRHHKDKKREKSCKRDSSSNSEDDVIFVPLKVSKPDTKSSSPENVKTKDVPSSHQPTAPVISNSSSGDNVLSIAETNALRAKLGLKPLSTPDSSSTGKSTEKSDEFVHKPAENIMDKKMTEKLRSKIAERKARREIEKKFSAVKSLGDDGSEDESAAAWVNKNKIILEARMKAELKAKELDEMDQEFGIGELVEEDIKKEKSAAYTAAHLKGLKVEHDIETFQEGKAIILTLKDQDILDESTDALVNVNLLDDERYKKNLFNKKQKPFGYNGVDTGEMDMDEPKGVLTKYDEEIEGAKPIKPAFTIGEENLEAKKLLVKRQLKEKANMRLESLILPEPKIASEYFSRDEMIKIKKPKKKKKIRKLTADDLLKEKPISVTQEDLGKRKVEEKEDVYTGPQEFMEVDEPIIKIKEEEEDPYLKRAVKKAMKLKSLPIEKLNKKLPNIEEVIMEVKEEPVDSLGSTIILNSTAEFCRTLGDIPTYGMAGNRDEEPDILLDFEREKEKKVKQKKKPDVIEDKGGWNDVEMNEKVVEVKPVEAPILDAEPDLGAGVAGALRLAVSKGYLEKDMTNRPSASRFSHLAAQNYSIDDKAHSVEDEKLGRRERYLGPTLDFKEKDGYKPNIKLEYIDDEGHLLSAKEAFRYLSHKFHGKGPGKNKVEKRMKKNEQEGLMKQMSSTDTPLGTLQMLQHKQKETQSAFVVLSGNKHQLNMPTTIAKTKMMK